MCPNQITAANTICLILCLVMSSKIAEAQEIKKFDQIDKFRQLDERLPTANDYRTSSGTPGKNYWQQQVDYEIDVELDDERQQITGSQMVTYTNRSPDPLSYIWLQLDANIFSPHSDANLTHAEEQLDRLSYRGLRQQLTTRTFDGSFKITRVEDINGAKLPFTIVKTMMRIDLPVPLRTNERFQFRVGWFYTVNDFRLASGRGGCEYFEDCGNFIYEIAQWHPRAAAYTDYTGWQHKQFLGSGEFTLDFGSYTVRITAPANHVVTATGELQNPHEVLTSTQIERLNLARDANTPQFIITPQEAKANELIRTDGKKTWVFQADQVRDFAFASSRKFIWDAMGHKTRDGRNVMCMSFYPNEAEPLWSKYSTHAVAHTLDVYGKYTFEYPYPVAISVNGPVGGMEYPMICFNGPRPEKDGTYSKRTKYGLISVIIHEVGHNWFPMIVNSDERQWTWLDEGLNTFVQSLAESEWEEDYPKRRGEPRLIIEYMISPNQVPVMTNSESLLQFGNNAYAKPAAALTKLRETIMGRELFDFAFKEYANRWMFKRPTPADFFRTMEDASAIDLDWFWYGWFYTTDHVDISISNLSRIRLKTDVDYLDKPRREEALNRQPPQISEIRNQDLTKRVEQFPELKDFYNEYNELAITEADRVAYSKFLADLQDEQKQVLESDLLIYALELENLGGLVSPIILQIEYFDGTQEERRFPAEIWRLNNQIITRLLIVEKPIKQVVLDQNWKPPTPISQNNYFPRRIDDSDIPIKNFDPRRGHSLDPQRNPMQQALDTRIDEIDATEQKSEKEIPDEVPTGNRGD